MLFQTIRLADKISAGQGVTFTRIDFPQRTEGCTALLWFSVSGEPSPRVLRLDIGKAWIIDMGAPQFNLTKTQWSFIESSIPAFMKVISEAFDTESEVLRLTRERLALLIRIEECENICDALEAEIEAHRVRVREIDGLMRKGVAICE